MAMKFGLPISLKKIDDWKFSRFFSALGFSGGGTSTGGYVSGEQAMRLATVYSCVRVLAELEAVIPLKLYQRESDGDINEVVDDEWGYSDLITYKPCEPFNAFEFRDMTATKRLVRGNALYHINRLSRGKIAELVVYEDGAITVDQAEKDARNRLIRPQYRINGTDTPTDEILHFRGPTLDGFNGVSVLKYAASAIDYAIEQEKYGTRMLKNGGKPGGIVELGEGKISDEKFERLKTSFNEAFSGDGTGKVAIMGHGSKFHQVAVTSQDAQFIENRKFQRSEICGLFRVPPHFVGDLEHATFSNIEHQAIQFVIYSLMPWLRRSESTYNSQLIRKKERQRGFFVSHDIRELLRGDSKARADFYKVLVGLGIMSPNEARNLEGMNKREGGDDFLTPMNMFAGEGDNEKKPGSEKL